jgi:hypothetical protein
MAHKERRLAGIVDTHIDPASRETLNHLLEDAPGLHEITLLKRDPRDFSNHEIRREVERGAQIRSLYELSQRILPSLARLSQNRTPFHHGEAVNIDPNALSCLDEGSRDAIRG